ncbi:glutathione S-transferase omega-1 [Strongylocentrotus purpuratus]|uniref:Glutathione S-transferase omega n=1 Tax=Strongylocentrotus purpuratus TaxID=7668 RepID=A0A7M7RDA0_STRPU|nr:glutathione S-transferase omega-1 [Strongylocentrotus purpuratus]|eukprot:XP_783642.2 PREDICTED: glutathione S-transferase omega-1 [Strongylocentrotus purpuratus]
MSRRHLKQGEANPTVKPDVLRLYSMGFCPFAQRALLVLAVKGIDYELVNCNLNHKPEFLLERNPAGTVPVLEFQGNIVTESLVICDLLEDLFPDKPLKAKDPFQKAKNRLAVGKFDSIVSLFYKVGYNPDDADAKETLRKSMKEYQAFFTAKKTNFFGGDQWGMVDLMVWPWIERMHVLGAVIIDDFVPEFKAWVDRMGTVPAVQACRISKEKLSEMYTGYFARNAVYD